MWANGINKNCKNFENIFIRDECNDAKKLNYQGPVAKNSYSFRFSYLPMGRQINLRISEIPVTVVGNSNLTCRLPCLWRNRTLESNIHHETMKVVIVVLGMKCIVFRIMLPIIVDLNWNKVYFHQSYCNVRQRATYKVILSVLY